MAKANKAVDAEAETETKATKAVATTQKGGAVAAYDYGDDSGKGMENISKDDLTIPFLKLLQSMSPEIDDSTPQFLPDAKPGMFLNSVTQTLYPGEKGVVFVPAITQHSFIEWKPIDQGGGFVGVHTPDSDIVKDAKAASTKFGEYKTPDGNELVETFNIFGVLADEDGDAVSMAVIPFTSTKIKPYKNFMAKLNMYQVKTPSGAKKTPPLFAHRVKLTAVKQKNTQGSFYNVVFSPAIGTTLGESLLPPGDKLLEAGKACYDLIREGKANADFSKETVATATTGGDPDGKAPF